MRKLSQVDVCKGIVSPSHYSNIESGRYEASEDILDLIANRLEVPKGYLTEIHKVSNSIKETLALLENKVNQDVEEAAIFLENNMHQLEYIPSIHQEVEYLILSCQLQLKLIQIDKAKQLHHEVRFYIHEKNVDALPKETKFKYYYVSALLQYYERSFKESFQLYEKSLLYTNTQQDKGKILFNLALICFNTNENQKGLQYAIEAKNIYLDLHFWKETVSTYTLLGILHMEVKEYAKASDVLLKGLNLAKEQGMGADQAKILHNLGMNYFHQQDYETSLGYFEKSLELKLLFDPKGTFLSYIPIAKIYLITHEIEKCNTCLSEAKKVIRGDLDKYTLQALEAKRELVTSNIKNYERLIEESINYFYNNKYWFELLDITKEFSEHLYKQRKYKKAYDYLKMELKATQLLFREHSS